MSEIFASPSVPLRMLLRGIGIGTPSAYNMLFIQ
jgi:hypothetical protein